jgi:hypothetical protein
MGGFTRLQHFSNPGLKAVIAHTIRVDQLATHLEMVLRTGSAESGAVD